MSTRLLSKRLLSTYNDAKINSLSNKIDRLEHTLNTINNKLDNATKQNIKIEMLLKITMGIIPFSIILAFPRNGLIKKKNTDNDTN